MVIHLVKNLLVGQRHFKLCVHADLHYRQPEAATKCCMKKDVLKNFSKLTGKDLFQNLFFNSVYPPSRTNLENKGNLQRY